MRNIARIAVAEQHRAARLLQGQVPTRQPHAVGGGEERLAVGQTDLVRRRDNRCVRRVDQCGLKGVEHPASQAVQRRGSQRQTQPHAPNIAFDYSHKVDASARHVRLCKIALC